MSTLMGSLPETPAPSQRLNPSGDSTNATNASFRSHEPMVSSTVKATIRRPLTGMIRHEFAPARPCDCGHRKRRAGREPAAQHPLRFGLGRAAQVPDPRRIWAVVDDLVVATEGTAKPILEFAVGRPAGPLGRRTLGPRRRFTSDSDGRRRRCRRCWRVHRTTQCACPDGQRSHRQECAKPSARRGDPATKAQPPPHPKPSRLSPADHGIRSVPASEPLPPRSGDERNRRRFPGATPSGHFLM
jgi:hypothetical protein